MNSLKHRTKTLEPAATFYQQRVEGCALRQRRLQRLDRIVSGIRGGLFLLAVILFAMGYAHPATRTIWVVQGAAVLFAFVAAVAYHEHVLRSLAETRELGKMNREHLSRLDRKWHQVPVVRVEIPADARCVARDLDLFGPASLFHLLCAANTPMGIARLRDWLSCAASPVEVVARQQAVRELTAERERREELTLRGRLLASGLTGPEKFLRWAEGPAWLGRRPVFRWVTRISPCVAIAAAGLALLQVITPAVGTVTFLAATLLNIAISVFFTGTAHDIFNRITSRSGEMEHYRALFELIASMPRGSARLQRIDQDTRQPRPGALGQLKRLRRLMRLANIRNDALFGIPYILLQILFLWDFHALALVERWQRSVGRQPRRWFEALAELEAIASLSRLADENPTWVFPTVRKGTDVFLARALGHPLLADAVRVVNDVTVGPAGTVLLVTGSNMSGKSTLLRAVGMNAILAQAGAPVCAEQLSMPPLTVTTSMRIDDSLTEGVSLFMAELKRLKHIVDQATACAEDPDWTLFYLLDEVLQGTNSVERHIAVGRVIAHLLAGRAMGAVSTHDLALAESDLVAGACRCIHFAESFVEEGGTRKMTFDYTLRPGLATTTNALILLDMVGLAPNRKDDRES